MATYVLVHGAYHGGWCWPYLTPLLEAEGHSVHTPTLTGLGDRASEASPDVGLSTHIEDIRSFLEIQDLKDVVLVGHSYGGPVVTGAADTAPERISSLVFLDAVIPQSGMSVLDFQYEERRQEFLSKAAAYNGWQIPPPPVSFYGIRDPEQQKWGDAHCVPQPLACFSEPSALTGAWEAIPKIAYIRCIDPALDYMDQFQARAENEGWDIYEMETGHDCMVTEPRQLADVLLKYA